MESEIIRVQSLPLDLLTGKLSQVIVPSSDLLVLVRSSSNDCTRNLHNKTHKNLEIPIHLDTEKYR
jgi:hypothetical protein